jgi:hypothetical protein
MDGEPLCRPQAAQTVSPDLDNNQIGGLPSKNLAAAKKLA